MGNEKSTNKPKYDVDHLKDFYGRDENSRRGKSPNKNSPSCQSQTQTLYIHGMALPYMKPEPNVPTESRPNYHIDSEPITEVEMMVCGPEGQELSEHYKLHPDMHKCGPNCYCLKKVILPHQGSMGNHMQQIHQMVSKELHRDLQPLDGFSPTSSTAFDMQAPVRMQGGPVRMQGGPVRMQGGNKSKKSKTPKVQRYSTSTTSTSDSSSFNSPDLTTTSSSSEGFVFSNSSLSTADLYRMQSRVNGIDSDSASEGSTYTERVGRAISKMEFDKNLFSSESKEILGMESSSANYMNKKPKVNPKYQDSKKSRRH
jgi:hypothetical protein